MKNKIKRPPKIAEWLLKTMANKNNNSAIMGDLEEEYYFKAEIKGVVFAWFWFWFLISISVPSFLLNHLYWSMIMFKNNMKITCRRILKQKMFSSINILSLTLGLTCSIFILLWVFDELSYDEFHKNIQDIYRVNCVQKSQNSEMDFTHTPHPWAALFKERVDEIQEITRLRETTCNIKYKNIVLNENSICFADNEIFNIFTFDFLQGNNQTALANPSSVVISKSIAEKYFPSIDPVGNILDVNNQVHLNITGVFENLPNNSTLDMDFIASYPSLKTLGVSLEKWFEFDCVTFLQIFPNTDVSQIESQMTKEFSEVTGVSSEQIRMKLDPLRKIHLYLKGGSGDIQYVYIFSIIAAIVLLLGCINFMNLSTAQSSKRAKEIGIKKTTGSTRSQLIFQFFGESMFMVVIALLFSLVLIQLFLPYFNNFLHKQLSLITNDFRIIYILLGITFLTGTISASYPAVYLSSFQPAAVLKSEIASKLSGKKLRQFLVISQFVISIVLIIATLTMTSQIKYLQNKKLGLNKDNILYLRLDRSMLDNFSVFKNKLLQFQDINNVTLTSSLPTNVQMNMGGVDWENKNPETNYLFKLLLVDQDFFKTFDINLAAGRSFSENFSADQNNYMLNEQAIKQMGIDDPIGKSFSIMGTEGIIVGIVKDFHFQPLHNQIGPIIFASYPRLQNWFEYIFIRYEGNQISATLDNIKKAHNELFAEIPFDYHFLDADYESLYQAEKRVLKLVEMFAALAIIIFCLGLLGLSSFMVERRTKEIGVRKVLGATGSKIVILLSSEFVRGILIANLFACPISWYVMNKWLQNFAYRTNISLWTFVLAGSLALFIALMTLSYQVVRAARANPINSLKYE